MSRYIHAALLIAGLAGLAAAAQTSTPEVKPQNSTRLPPLRPGDVRELLRVLPWRPNNAMMVNLRILNITHYLKQMQP